MDNPRHAKRLHVRIIDFDEQLEKLRAKRDGLVSEKQERLTKAALSPRVNGASTIQRLSDGIRVVEQEIEDKEFQRRKLREELTAAADRIKADYIAERTVELEAVTAQIEDILRKVHDLRAEAFRLEGRLSRQALIEGEPVAGEGLRDKVLEIQGDISMLQQRTEADILAELGIELETTSVPA